MVYIFGVIVMLSAPCAFSQFLQLGPFAFEAETEVKGIYTTNVEQERPSETDDEREDFYGVWRIGLSSSADLSRFLSVTADTGLGIEKHWNRPDLDNSEEPFSRAAVEALLELSRYTMYGRARYERTAESQESVYIPGGRKQRDVRDETEMAAGATWEFAGLYLSGEYEYTTERHDAEEFRDADQNETTVDSLISYTPWDWITVEYENERTRTDLLIEPGSGEWEETETFRVIINYLQEILKRPQLSYAIGIEKEDEDGEEGEWELIHTFSLSDEAELSRSLRYRVGAQYTHEDQEEETDISFIYSGQIEHDISDTARHAFYFSREPVETLGSTEETDNTTYGYSFEKNDLFIYDVTLQAGVSYEIDKPLVEFGEEQVETEMTWIYTVSLDYTKELTTKLARSLAYEFSHETSNLETESLTEHRVTLSYLYRF